MGLLGEFRLQGNPVSEGVAIGYLFFLPALSEEFIPEFSIEESFLAAEVSRYYEAVEKSKEDLLLLKGNLEKEGSQEALEIIETHVQMLRDPLITMDVEQKIKSSQRNAESVFSSVIRDYEKKFSKITDPFFQQRIVDVLDLSKRILEHLAGKSRVNFSEIPRNSIVFAKELVPSHTAAIQASRVSAFVTQQGGGCSHAALIARSKGIPYISSIDVQVLQDAGSSRVIVDGESGEIIFYPILETLRKYQELKIRFNTTYKLLQQEVFPCTETMDGYVVHVYANVGSLADLEEFQICKPEGIGLFRTEYLFLDKNIVFLSEEEQIDAYAKVFSKAEGFPIVVRVFDVGGDKNPDMFLEYEKETNPILGCRGIRFLLRHPILFRTQLRALMKAFKQTELKILLPLVSDIGEVIQSKKIIQEVEEELKKQGEVGDLKIVIGCMIEVPSAAFLCDVILREVDFLSIGTNDLVQYTLGMDRSNPAVRDFFYPAHPSILRMIKMIVEEAKRQNKPVTICGEMASNPVFIPLLLGLGLTDFSCSFRHIPLVKRAVRQCLLLRAVELAEKILQLSSHAEIAQALADFQSKTV